MLSQFLEKIISASHLRRRRIAFITFIQKVMRSTKSLKSSKSCRINTMEHEEITHKIIAAAYQVFNKLGFGFLESVYKKGMTIELSKDNLKVEAEKPLKVYYDDQAVGDFYVDLLVEDEIIARPPRLSEQLN